MIVEFRFDEARPRAWMIRLAKLIDDGQTDIKIAWLKTGATRPAAPAGLPCSGVVGRGAAPTGPDELTT